MMTAKTPKIRNGTIFFGKYSNFTRILANRAPRDLILKTKLRKKTKNIININQIDSFELDDTNVG